MRLKHPAQPLVFYFSGVSPLCAAALKLYDRYPGLRASLCLYRGRYFMKVDAGLLQRAAVLRDAGEYGPCLGACCVLYSYFEEHGFCISHDAISQLGSAFHR